MTSTASSFMMNSGLHKNDIKMKPLTEYTTGDDSGNETTSDPISHRSSPNPSPQELLLLEDDCASAVPTSLSVMSSTPVGTNLIVDTTTVGTNLIVDTTTSPVLSAPWKLGSTTSGYTNNGVSNIISTFHERLLNQSSGDVESVLASTCEVMGFHIAEVWLRTGIKTHQLINSHVRPTKLEDSVRKHLVDVYYGEHSSERTHKVSPALCKKAKEAGDVIWVGADLLQYSLSNVKTAVAVPISHETTHTNMTVIFFSMRQIPVQPAAIEFFVHLSLAAGVASINSLSTDSVVEPSVTHRHTYDTLSRSDNHQPQLTEESQQQLQHQQQQRHAIQHQRPQQASMITGAPLTLQWRSLANVEYLTDGGNSWIHSAVYQGKPVVIKTLKPEAQDLVLAMNEMESEMALHARLSHENIVTMIGAGTTSKGVRFLVLERLDGGTLAQMLGYDTRIRDRRRRFWRKKQFSYVDVLRIGRATAEAMRYLHEDAIPGCTVLHRDLKPDNIGFTLEGTVKVFDFGLARVLENASVESDAVYEMSGETGSLRYMAPEVADGLPYNFKADVYSFGIILWELVAGKKPFEGLNRDLFYERVVHGGERPIIRSKWPKDLSTLMSQCWDADISNRPTFREIATKLATLLEKEKGGSTAKPQRQLLPKLGNMIDRHSTWF